MEGYTISGKNTYDGGTSGDKDVQGHRQMTSHYRKFRGCGEKG